MEFWLSAMAPGLADRPTSTTPGSPAIATGRRTTCAGSSRPGPTATATAGTPAASTRRRCSWTRSLVPGRRGRERDRAHVRRRALEGLRRVPRRRPRRAAAASRSRAATTAPFLAAEGGVGYGVTTWTANPELAAELALAMADTGRDDDLLRAVRSHRVGHDGGPVRLDNEAGGDDHQRAPGRSPARPHGARPRRASTSSTSSASNSPPARSASMTPWPRWLKPTRLRGQRADNARADPSMSAGPPHRSPSQRTAGARGARSLAAAPRPGDALRAGGPDARHHRRRSGSTR